ncbi:MAG: hypothetical protein EPO30_10410 [Lysobacteraceae bacterium]|nr:MAG: hypothetical protein EPO30_10410 [Xanthomonadaceae bacterium]
MEVPVAGPLWDSHFPGLMAWELERLRKRARAVEIDQPKLAKGLLVVRFEWPFGESFLALEASFPSSYPFLRPQVRLLSGREDWPEHHVSPVDGTVCLLGRDTAQWSPAYHLAKLLTDQLENALLGDGAEDPQAEPADVWWNGLAPLPDSYCLVDSDWKFDEESQGRLDFFYVLDECETPRIRGVIRRVLADDDTVLAEWSGPLPAELAQAKRRISVRWYRAGHVVLPHEPVVAQLRELRNQHLGGLGAPTSVGKNLSVRPFVLVHPIEKLGGGHVEGWIFGLEWGTPRAFGKKGRRADHGIKLSFLPILRAGSGDLHQRVPDAAPLRGKRVAVFGVGAIGAPIAIELARNGVAELRLVDHDIVEPGNSERWPLGAASWGRRKTEALAEHLRSQFPDVTIVPVHHQLGHSSEQGTDDSALALALVGADIVVDAMVSSGVTYFLWDRCMRQGASLVKVGATPTLGGGSVVLYVRGGGCPVCLQYARIDESVATPPGGGETPLGIQPPGCGERTFTGADYDLQELSLQSVRLVVDTLREGKQSGLVQTLALKNMDGERILPRWSEQALPQHIACCAKPDI